MRFQIMSWENRTSTQKDCIIAKTYNDDTERNTNILSKMMSIKQDDIKEIISATYECITSLLHKKLLFRLERRQIEQGLILSVPQMKKNRVKIQLYQ